MQFTKNVIFKKIPSRINLHDIYIPRYKQRENVKILIVCINLKNFRKIKCFKMDSGQRGQEIGGRQQESRGRGLSPSHRRVQLRHRGQDAGAEAKAVVRGGALLQGRASGIHFTKLHFGRNFFRQNFYISIIQNLIQKLHLNIYLTGMYKNLLA
jgi:hypothetical protein